MSQTLRNVAFSDNCYTIIFITVSSHSGETFSFLNQPNLRLEFFWNKWNPWKDTLKPYTTHAFLVHAFSSKSESGMNFIPVLHLCSFLNQNEARVFNAAYLTHYNKLYEEGDVVALNDLSTRFGEALQDMSSMRDHWMEECERAAGSIMNSELFDVFGFKHPEVRNAYRPWEAEIPVDEWSAFDFVDEEIDDEKVLMFS